MAVSYLLSNFAALRSIPSLLRPYFARMVFGEERVNAIIKKVNDELLCWGYTDRLTAYQVPRALCQVILINRSPLLEDLTTEVLVQVRDNGLPRLLNTALVAISRALTALGFIEEPLKERIAPQPFDRLRRTDGISKEWLDWIQRWRQTSTYAPRTRTSISNNLLRVGRWLAQMHPEIASPAQWTREIAAEFVAAVDRMKIGDWSSSAHLTIPHKIGKPLMARSKNSMLGALRAFFQSCTEWGWITTRFDARRSFSTPLSIRSQIGPDPRVIADDRWAKLLWAGLNLTADDLPVGNRYGRTTHSEPTPWYPIEMVRAIAIVWLFAGLRSNEINRLRVGCLRWQHHDVPILGTDETLPRNAVCLLEIPINKTSTAFTKPVDPVVGEAISKWEDVRPQQPLTTDPKTGESVHFLFLYRGRRIGYAYVNEVIIPSLCRKAGIPIRDSRGNITSHRARSTIASQLFNAKEPMSLFELQEWLGHRSPETTQHYAKITPTRLAKSYSDVGYFERNIRRINVLIDQDKVRNGAAARGEPWKFYDLGHGYCAYDFFDQCPHRMACAKCSFYLAKDSSKLLLIEGKGNLLRMLQEVPLTDEERSAVEDGIAALDKLAISLADIPTPDGRTPNELVQITKGDD
jgi:integrase